MTDQEMTEEERDGVLLATLAEALKDRNPAVQQVGGWFTFGHLVGRARERSRACCELAVSMILTTPDSPELTAGLRKLLEAKDCFVRSSLGGPL